MEKLAEFSKFLHRRQFDQNSNCSQFYDFNERFRPVLNEGAKP